MFDDFDLTIQSDEIIPEEYDDWCKWMYSSQDDLAVGQGAHCGSQPWIGQFDSSYRHHAQLLRHLAIGGLIVMRLIKELQSEDTPIG